MIQLIDTSKLAPELLDATLAELEAADITADGAGVEAFVKKKRAEAEATSKTIAPIVALTILLFSLTASAQTNVYVGAAANDRTGDPGRLAFQKLNYFDNFNKTNIAAVSNFVISASGTISNSVVANTASIAANVANLTTVSNTVNGKLAATNGTAQNLTIGNAGGLSLAGYNSIGVLTNYPYFIAAGSAGTVNTIRPTTGGTGGIGTKGAGVLELNSEGYVYTAGLATGYRTVAANYTFVEADHTVYANAASGAITITLRSPASAISNARALEYRVIKIDSTTNRVTIQSNGGGLINGLTSRYLSISYQAESFKTDGSNYFMVGDGTRPRAYVTDYWPPGAGVGDAAHNATAFARALALNYEVYVPSGVYTINDTITLHSRQKLIGIGYAQLNFVATNKAMFEVESAGQNWHLENLLITDSTSSKGTKAISLLGDNKRWTITRCMFGSFKTAAFYSGVGDVSYGSIRECFFFRTSNATEAGGSGSGLGTAILTTNLFSAITIDTCWFNFNDRAIYLGGGSVGVSGVEFLNNSIEGSGQGTIGADSTIIIQEAADITAIGNRLEANVTATNGASWYLNGISSFEMSGGLIANDYLGTIYGNNSIFITGRIGTTDCAARIGGVYFNNLGTNGLFIGATNMARVEAVGNKFDLGSGGGALSDSQIASRLTGNVVVRGRGTASSNKIPALDSTGKIEAYTSDPIVTSLTVGTPTITSGTGVPGVSQPNGSLFLRMDGTGPNIYARENGAWVAK
jgi:hypothetical protein